MAPAALAELFGDCLVPRCQPGSSSASLDPAAPRRSQYRLLLRVWGHWLVLSPALPSWVTVLSGKTL